MKYELLSNNKVFLCGTIESEAEFSHESFGEAFYEIKLSVKRLSNQSDIVPITISDKLLTKDMVKGSKLAIKGQFRSYNKIEDNKSKLMLTVFVRELIEYNETMNPNIIEISGYICKEPTYRTTPFKREICDVLIAVNRAYNKSDYLPCIAWGRNARFVKNLEIGKKVNLVGRIQSREYQKKLEDGSIVSKMAYEVSINKISDEAKEELLAVLLKGQSLYKVHFVLLDSESFYSSVNYGDWYKTHIAANEGLYIGDGFADQYTLKSNKISNSYYDEIGNDFGYVVHKGKTFLTKLLTMEDE